MIRSMMTQLGNQGQSQILGVTILSLSMLTAGLFTLDRARKTQEWAIKGARVTEMRAALEAGIQRAAAIYRTEASCDPALLQNKLSYLLSDGSLDESKIYRRQLTVTVNGRSYTVSFGSVTPLPWNNGETDPSLDTTTGVPVAAGTSQDAEIEVWTSVPNQATDTGGGTRTSMRAVLINTCLIRCDKKLPTDSSQAAGEICQAGSNSAIINNPRQNSTLLSLPSSLPSSTAQSSVLTPKRSDIPCESGSTTRYLGDIPIQSNYDDAADSDVVNALDLAILTQFLQQGDAGWLTSTTALNAGTKPSCADLNLDGQINELDRGIMQKWMRGYLFRVPTNPNWN